MTCSMSNILKTTTVTPFIIAFLIERVKFYIIGKCEKNHMFCQLLPLHLKYVCAYVCVCARVSFLKNVTVG